MKNRIYILIAGFLLITAACSGHHTNTAISGNASAGKARVPEKRFVLPQIPDSLTVPAERADWLAMHYWDLFDFKDTALVFRPEIGEQALADFLDVLRMTGEKIAGEAMAAMMDRASADSAAYRHFTALAGKYLYDVNSPFSDETRYVPVLQHALASPLTDPTEKIRLRHRLTMAMTNRPGERAADFEYILADGRKGRMSRIKARYTVLFFNDPGCEDCRRVKDYIADSKVFASLCRSSDNGIPRLVILAVYTEGDVISWQQTRYPHFILNARDGGQVIERQALYDLKAMPTLYLLDREKKVLMKDASVEKIEEYLSRAELSQGSGK
ncbi:DUF5106 domain-containing protein [Coprobacter tertius]|uniref:DUF5106 domain-containing protein n=1 Tax=Coprobacter tertius TaxID=2944915 RepID=A0ABT1MFI0_9BACT|nr:DUF5106 domain-containing protein [Coprobacter tertius]MCP9611389.1 DUF5106 domain-containing protein [Coprobacter tertius]